MSAVRTDRRGLRRAALAVVAGIAFTGATLVGATAATAVGDTPPSCIATSSASALVSGVATGLLDCITGAAPAPSTSAAPVPTDDPTSAAPIEAPTAPEPTAPVATAQPEPSIEPTATASAPVDAVASAPVAEKSGELRSVRVITNTTTVYPSAKGYEKSSVRFSIRGLTAARAGVRITGEAVLRKGAQVVRTWRIGTGTTTLTWDGRNRAKVDPGRYVLTATAWSSDGARAMSTMRVRVSAKHLVTRTVSVRTSDLSKARSNMLPVAVMKGFHYGEVTYRVHTVAKVTGPARLLITGPTGERVSIPLRDGTHVTRPAVLAQSFTFAAFDHQWKKGAAQLDELYTVFTFKELVR